MTSREFITSVLKTAGEISLRGFFNHPTITVKEKEDQSNILTEIDLEVGRYLIQKI